MILVAGVALLLSIHVSATAQALNLFKAARRSTWLSGGKSLFCKRNERSPRTNEELHLAINLGTAR